MVEMALDMTGRTRDEAVLVGDRLYTDIACANMADISAALCFQANLHAKKCRTRSILWSMSIHP